jgi:hypothetical protein
MFFGHFGLKKTKEIDVVNVSLWQPKQDGRTALELVCVAINLSKISKPHSQTEEKLFFLPALDVLM